MDGNSTAKKPIAVRSLLDTNVLVYADAADDVVKQRRAIDLITSLRAAGSVVLSTQVLQEYVNVALRKLRLPHVLVRERLNFYRRFEIVPTSPDLIAGALDLHVLHGISFYDALIVQAAGCQRLPAGADRGHAARRHNRRRAAREPVQGCVKRGRQSQRRAPLEFPEPDRHVQSHWSRKAGGFSVCPMPTGANSSHFQGTMHSSRKRVSNRTNISSLSTTS